MFFPMFKAITKKGGLSTLGGGTFRNNYNNAKNKGMGVLAKTAVGSALGLGMLTAKKNGNRLRSLGKRSIDLAKKAEGPAGKLKDKALHKVMSTDAYAKMASKLSMKDGMAIKGRIRHGSTKFISKSGRKLLSLVAPGVLPATHKILGKIDNSKETVAGISNEDIRNMSSIDGTNDKVGDVVQTQTNALTNMDEWEDGVREEFLDYLDDKGIDYSITEGDSKENAKSII